MKEFLPGEIPAQMREMFREGYKKAIKDVVLLLAGEDKNGDPDDLYTGRTHRIKRVESLNAWKLPTS